jgi:isoquinoline 1-oxidoreductase beta subunit
MLQTAPDKIAEEALDGAADLPYAIPNLRVDYCPVNTPVPLGWWRSVYASQNCFANESFIDELARETGRDPFDLRRELLTDAPRHRRVLELAADKAGWGSALPAGRGRGIAVHRLFSDTVCAEVAEVSILKSGVRVDRVVCAVDCGLPLNPDTIAAQIEGGVVYGLSAALRGQITLEAGRVKQSNFNDYPLLRMRDMPRVEVHLVESADSPHGVGEPAVPPIAPAVANAIFQATGTRLRSMPLTLA